MIIKLASQISDLKMIGNSLNILTTLWFIIDVVIFHWYIL